MKTTILLTLLILTLSVGSDMELQFERVCFEMGGTMNQNGFCDLDDLDSRLLRDLNISRSR